MFDCCHLPLRFPIVASFDARYSMYRLSFAHERPAFRYARACGVLYTSSIDYGD